MDDIKQSLKVVRLGIDTYKEAVIYIREDSFVCQAEGFEAQARIRVRFEDTHIIATLNTIKSDILKVGYAGLSEHAIELLGVKEGDEIYLSHPEPLLSLRKVRAKIYGNRLSGEDFTEIINDIVAGRLSDIHISSFLTACAGNHLDQEEILGLTKSMIDAGARIAWPSQLIVDKHCVGGLPGNKTSLIVVPIVAAFGLIIPKTSSRAITSAAGTADTMETLAPVNLSFSKMQAVVEKENGCIVWGGSVLLSPADDVLIRVEQALDLDGEGQLVASVLSKKVAAGSNHVVIDIPIGPTAKVRDRESAEIISNYLTKIGKKLGLDVKVVYTDGSQPVGNGIGPALSARDVLAVLQGKKDAPQDLRDRALDLAGHILEFSERVKSGTGRKMAEKVLSSGRAWHKFQAICEAQGGMWELPKAKFTHTVVANLVGKVQAIDNRRIARVGKLAGAPLAKAAGVDLHVKVDAKVEKKQPLFTVHAESQGELEYALNFVKADGELIQIGS
jgi:thymidine phosphorylase